MKLYITLFSFIVLSIPLRLLAQDPEFPKGFIMHLKLHNGMVTAFHTAPDLYVGGVQLIPQVTVVEHLLRAGVIADGFYTDKKLGAAVGPTLSLKIKTLKAGFFGSAGNIHLMLNHLWGTEKQRLAGGGIVGDFGNKITFGITAHRDYNLNTWWFQNEIGIRISKKPAVKEPFNE